MTLEQQREALAKVDELLCEAQGLVADINLARDETGELIEGDAIWTALTNLNNTITILRDCGESPDYYAAWERPPEQPSR